MRFKDIHIKRTLSAGTYSTDNFNAKANILVLQQRQDWEALQIKDSMLVILNTLHIYGL